jgi:hypothetical protein
MAQSVPVYQMGTTLQNDLAKYQRNGEIRNSGGIAGDNNGLGANPFSVTDYGQLGFCSNSAPTSGPYSQICIGHDSQGNGKLTVDSLNGAPNHGFVFELNGQQTALPIPLPPAAPCPAITSYGGVADGTTDNVAAWAALTAVSRCVYFPRGTYRFNAQVGYTLSANSQVMQITGDGPDTTILLWPAGGGIRIAGAANRTAFHVRDLSLVTSAVNTGVAFDAEWGGQHNDDMASSSFDRVRISGDVFGTNYWATGILLNGISAVNFNSVDIWGQSNSAPTQGIDLDLVAPPTNLSFIYNVVNSNFYGALYGIRYGANTQGLQIVNTNFTLNQIGIFVPSSAVGMSQLSVVNSQFDNTSDNIVFAAGGSMPQVSITNNIFFLAPNTWGINILGGVGWAQITNNQFDATVGTTTDQAGGGINANGLVGVSNIDGSVCVHLDNCIILGANNAGTHVSNTRVDSTSTKLAVINNSPQTTNFITGFINPGASAEFYPYAVNVTGAASNGVPNLIRLTITPGTVPPGTSGFTNGQVLFVNAPGVGNMPGPYAITIVDATHIDLLGSVFSGAYTTGGNVWTMP